MISNVLYAVLIAERGHAVFAALCPLRSCRCTEIEVFLRSLYRYSAIIPPWRSNKKRPFNMFISVAAMNLMSELSYS